MSADTGKPAAKALQAGCAFQRSTNIQVYTKALLLSVAALTESTASKRRDWLSSLINATSNTGVRALWNAVELTLKIFYDICHWIMWWNQCWINTRDSENWCVIITTASFWWAFQWRLCWTQTFLASRADMDLFILYSTVCCAIQHSFHLSEIHFPFHKESFINKPRLSSISNTAQCTLTKNIKHGSTIQRRAS